MAEADHTIKDIENVLKIEGKIKNVKCSRLTAPGENYISLVLKVDMEVEENGTTKIINAVAKKLPPVPLISDKKEGEKPDFNFHGIAMANEIKWYVHAVPKLKEFAKEYSVNLDFYPDYLGSRLSLDPSKEEADDDSVLILENLGVEGFENGDRYIGFDYITSKAVLKSLAAFHAVSIAYKILKPDLFESSNKCALMSPEPPFKDKDGKPIGPPPPKDGIKPEEILFEKIQEIPECKPYLTKLKVIFDNFGHWFMTKAGKEPWATVSHSDFWINNVMVKPSKDQPRVKIVDFQVCKYRSFAADLVFFLLTSVRNDILKEYIDDLLRFYYDNFTDLLRKFSVNLELSYDDYLKQLEEVAKENEIKHSLFFSTIVFGPKGKEAADITSENTDREAHMKSMIRNMNQHQKDKLATIIAVADKKGWL